MVICKCLLLICKCRASLFVFHEQVKVLKEMGAEHVLNSSEPDFDKELSKLVKRLNATVCFEAISGTATGQIMKAMPPKSISIVYGLLSEEKI